MEKYTQEDKDAFARKDKLNARMSALKAASVHHEGDKSFGSVDILAETNEFYNWLMQDQVNGNMVTAESIIAPLPVPTKDQAKWLEQIEKNYNFTKEQIYKKMGKFPSTKDQAQECVKIMRS